MVPEWKTFISQVCSIGFLSTFLSFFTPLSRPCLVGSDSCAHQPGYPSPLMNKSKVVNTPIQAYPRGQTG